jgi:hypothetical protein
MGRRPQPQLPFWFRKCLFSGYERGRNRLNNFTLVLDISLCPFLSPERASKLVFL